MSRRGAGVGAGARRPCDQPVVTGSTQAAPPPLGNCHSPLRCLPQLEPGLECRLLGPQGPPGSREAQRPPCNFGETGVVLFPCVFCL